MVDPEYNPSGGFCVINNMISLAFHLHFVSQCPHSAYEFSLLEVLNRAFLYLCAVGRWRGS